MRTPEQLVRFNYWLSELTSSQYMAAISMNDNEKFSKHIADRDEAHKALREMYENA